MNKDFLPKDAQTYVPVEFRIAELCNKIIKKEKELIEDRSDYYIGRISTANQIRKLIFETSCSVCDYEPKCECSWDLYNIDTVAKIDCLMSK